MNEDGVMKSVQAQLDRMELKLDDTRDRTMRLEAAEAARELERKRSTSAIQDLDRRVSSIETENEANKKAGKRLAAIVGVLGGGGAMELIHRIFGSH